MERSKRGFTLIELLVVIAIIAILAAILFPAFVSAKNRAMTMSCLSNISQVSKGVLMYVDDNNSGIPPCFSEPDGHTAGTAWTWRYCIQRYVKNRKIWVCPAFAKTNIVWGTPQMIGGKDDIGSSYGLNMNVAGNNSTIWNWGTRPITKFSRPSKTIMLCECMNGMYYPYWQILTNQNGYLRTYFPTFHQRMIIVSFLDGHTKLMFLRDTLNTNVANFMWDDIDPKDTGAIADIAKLIQTWPRSYPPNGE